MALKTGEANQKVKAIQQAVEDYSILLGQRSAVGAVAGLDVAPGLDMEVEASAYSSMADALGEGIFKLMIMGPFKNGKSTTINALVGEYITATKATACTAVINITKSGTDTQNVKVYHSDSDEPQIISKERFLEEYNITDEEIEKIQECGCGLERYQNVEYAETECDHELFRNGVQIIDSPGLEENVSRTKATLGFVPKANAIIFELSAIKLFSASEREYIEENFVGKQRKNVFFLVNRMNQLTDANNVADVKKSVKKVLHDVFVDEDGNFDEELFQKRVFFINAYGAYCAKIGKPQKIVVDDEIVAVQEKDTGMPEFERALTEFLTSEERLVATFQSTLSNMATSYSVAEKKHEDTVQSMSQSLEEMKENVKSSKEQLDELDNTIRDMETKINRTSKQVQKKVYDDLIHFVSVTMPKLWEKESKDKKVPFGLMDNLKLFTVNVPWKSNEEKELKQRKVLKPLTDEIEAFCRRQLNAWKASIPTLTANDIKDLEAELNEDIKDFDIGLSDAALTFQTGNAGKAPEREMGWKGRLQQAAALANMDFSLVTEIENTGKMSMGQFAKQYGSQLAIDMLVAAVLGGGIWFFVAEAVTMVVRAKKTGENLMQSMAAKFFAELQADLKKKEYQITQPIKANFDEKSKVLTATARGLVAEETARQAKLLEMKAGQEKDFKAETDRQEKVLDAMFERFSGVYQELYGSKPSMDDLNKMAVAEQNKERV